MPQAPTGDTIDRETAEDVVDELRTKIRDGVRQFDVWLDLLSRLTLAMRVTTLGDDTAAEPDDVRQLSELDLATAAFDGQADAVSAVAARAAAGAQARGDAIDAVLAEIGLIRTATARL